MTTPTNLDNAVTTALTYGEEHALPDQIDLDDGERILVRRRAGEEWQTVDISDQHREQPRRSRGTVDVHDGASFALAVQQRGTAVVYADEEKLTLVAVLNDDFDGAPGWRDHRVGLALRSTSEWKGWKGGQGLGDQQRFAERIEDGGPEIVDPAAAVMMEMAQTFHASVDTKFRSGTRLSTGQTQFLYEEDVKGTAGAEPGTITIPETFTLGVAPFIGAQPYEVTARLRYRLRAGDLQIGYFLVRPEDVERDAFLAVLADVAAAMPDTAFVRGPAPSNAS